MNVDEYDEEGRVNFTGFTLARNVAQKFKDEAKAYKLTNDQLLELILLHRYLNKLTPSTKEKKLALLEKIESIISTADYAHEGAMIHQEYKEVTKSPEGEYKTDNMFINLEAVTINKKEIVYVSWYKPDNKIIIVLKHPKGNCITVPYDSISGDILREYFGVTKSQ